jgi:hypothetical protein
MIGIFTVWYTAIWLKVTFAALPQPSSPVGLLPLTFPEPPLFAAPPAPPRPGEPPELAPPLFAFGRPPLLCPPALLPPAERPPLGPFALPPLA